MEKAVSSETEVGGSRRPDGLAVLFCLAAFLGAALLFVVQPLIARLLLPAYGGSPGVWSTSSLFFQVLLLAGYAYAHVSVARFGRLWQPRTHVLVLLIPLVALPIALPDGFDPGSSPIATLLTTLALVIGLPFVVLSTTGPILQTWYSWAQGRGSDDPYFLFAASNLGSFVGLLAYPFVIEPTMTLDQQRAGWSWAFVAYGVAMMACAMTAIRRGAGSSGAVVPPVPTIREAIPAARVLRWGAWAFLPSAMMLAITSHITTDVAAFPMLWVLPLAIYLATFVVAFGRRARRVGAGSARAAVALGLAAATASALPGAALTVIPEIALQLVMLGSVGYVAHARLAADRPDPAHLTYYYLVISVGGALGGLLNGLIAPLVFDRVLEYPLVMLAVPFLLVGLDQSEGSWLDRLANRQLVWSVGLLGLAAVAATGVVSALRAGADIALVPWAAVLLLVGVLAVRMSAQPRLLCAVLVVLFGAPMAVQQVQSLDQSRTFFGSYQVLDRGGQHILVHGTTVHGTQFLDDRGTEPTTYYSRGGPLGDVFTSGEYPRVGAIGLGVGTLIAYGDPTMHFTFFEIDSEVVRIAEDPSLFRYLSDSPSESDMVVGDGRLEVAKEPDGAFDLLVLDAFSSDAIPVHLLTLEAMRTYAAKLAPDGLLAVHISNRVFGLEPVLRAAARDLGWSAATRRGGGGPGAVESEWVVLSPDPSSVEALVDAKGWQALDGDEVVWTDDFSSLLAVLK